MKQQKTAGVSVYSAARQADMAVIEKSVEVIVWHAPQ